MKRSGLFRDAAKRPLLFYGNEWEGRFLSRAEIYKELTWQGIHRTPPCRHPGNTLQEGNLRAFF